MLDLVVSRSKKPFPQHWLYQSYLMSFGKELSALGYRKSTQQEHLSAVGAFLFWWESQHQYSLQSFGRREADRYYAYLVKRPLERGEGTLSGSMLRHQSQSLRLFFGFLSAWDFLLGNPLSAWYPAPSAASRREEILSNAQITRLYQVVEHPLERVLLDVYYGCGLRRSEGIGLDIRDINLNQGWLEVRKGKGGTSRRVPLTPRLQLSLRIWLWQERGVLASGRELALLVTHSGRRLSGNRANTLFQRLQLRAGILAKYSLHHLRHSIASHLLSGGLSLEQVRDFLGHRHLESTQVYLHSVNHEPSTIAS